MELKSKVALVTGASRGIGKATAIQLAKEGANIALNFRSHEEAAVETLRLLEGEEHELFQEDISLDGAPQQLVESVIQRMGRIDILVNNAGVAIHHNTKDSFKTWKDSWNKTINTNLIAAADLCYWAAQNMKKNGGGRIINVSSRGAFRGEPDQIAYGVSKAGLNSLSQSLAKELAPDNIYVFVVAPGFTETDMGISAITEDEKKKLVEESPLGRMAQPEEVAHAITYFAKEGSEFSSGTIIDVNGASYLRS